MAVVTLTLTDDQEDGNGDVSLTLAYDPPVVLETPTAAQEMASWMLLRLRGEFTTEIRRVVAGGAE